MEQHGYGYGGPAGGRGGGAAGQDPSAGSAAAARPRGWSSLTRQLRNPSPPPRDPFPPLVIATAPASSKNRAGHASTNSGERSEEQGGNSNNNSNRIQQRQRGETASPASSTGSFSSNYSGRNNSWGRQADAQAAFSSTAAAGGGDQQQGFFSAATGSPPESSSGSFAPNSSISKHPHPTPENHHGLHRQSKGSGPTSSAGSFSLNPYSWVQSGAYDARVAGFQSSSQVVVNGMERGGSGGGKRGVQVGQQAEQVHGYKSALKRREFNNSYEVAVVNEGTRDETSAAERDILDNAKPTVSDGRSSIGDADRDFNGAHEQQGKDAAGDSTAASSAFHVPIEPEWEEEEDMYHSIRSGALKEARARDKFARGALQAYVHGDHRKAKALSKQAEEKRLIAEKLHAEAAFEILNQRNKHGSFDIWHLDLHGLHTAEAVAALESRLALLEHGLAKDHMSELVSPSSQLQRGGQDQGVVLERKAVVSSEAGQTEHEYTKHKLFQSLIPASKLLSVITGVGVHSQQGPALPSAVKTFLINNGYQLEEPRAGVVSVRPKLHFSV